MADAASLNKYGVATGSQEDIEIHKRCKQYVDNVTRYGKTKLEDLRQNLEIARQTGE